MSAPKRIEISSAEMDALLERLAKQQLQDDDFEIIRAMAETIKYLSLALDQKNMSIKRLRKMIFGAGSEKTKNVVNQQEGAEKASEEETGPSRAPPEKEKEKRKGHGRNGADSYRGADRVTVEHKTLKPKDPCPACSKGKLYPMKAPAVILNVVGRAPVHAAVFELDRLRCNLCGKIFTAEPPEGCADTKYDETAGSIIAVLRYGYGFPFYRLEKLQESFEIPLPASTQWGLVEAKAETIKPVYDELVREAAQGKVLHNDDTTMKIQALMQTGEDESRTGMFTTAIIACLGDRKIALFYTGRNHAGENMLKLLQQREADRSPPIQMCDALSRNVPEGFKVILSNCNAHARRKFVDIAEIFPEECTFVLNIFKQVYYNDDLTRKQQMTGEQRLEFHQSESGPLMEKLKNWLEAQLQDKKVEPNSSLGDAFSYILNHWKPLTLFLREPNAPLDNNICERALKKSILHRKNSLFYKTLHGAYVGDVFMSIIHTCNLSAVNAFEYLTIIEKQSVKVSENPALWLPWNYQQQFDAAAKLN